MVEVVTGVMVRKVSLAELGSVSEPVTPTSLVSRPGLVALMTTVTILSAPLARLPRPQLMKPLDWLQPLEAETKSTFGGKRSVNVTPVASEGPALCTVIVYVTSLLSRTGLGAANAVTDRSAIGPTLT